MSGYAVVIVLHDSAADLRRLLDSLRAADPRPAQVIVVDAGSADHGPQVGRDAGCLVIEAGDVGFGAANNAGVAAVTAPVTILLNPDVVVTDPAALGRLASLATAAGALHVPRLLNDDGSIQDSAHPLPGSPAALAASLLPARLLGGGVLPWRSRRPRRAGWAIAAAVAARTATLRDLGPFDPGQFLFFEDLDLCLRAAGKGVPTLLDPRIELVHSGAHSTGPAYGGEPHELLARRRREVVAAQLGPASLRRDDAIQALTFSRAALLRTLTGRGAARPRAQLRALRAARAGVPGTSGGPGTPGTPGAGPR
ncbi:MAG: glycosyltransferase [Baekduia sp.]